MATDLGTHIRLRCWPYKLTSSDFDIDFFFLCWGHRRAADILFLLCFLCRPFFEADNSVALWRKMKSLGLEKSKTLRLKIACQMTKMVSFSECGLQRLCHPPNPPLLTPIGHFSISMPITCCYYIYFLSLFRLLILAGIRLGPTFCGQNTDG